MSIRFIIGRAGSGKTHYCLEAVRARLREDAVDGPRAIMLVPEQAALQTERAIITPSDLRASHRAEVVSFRRLAFRVLEEVGDGGVRAISEPARAMVLRRLLAAHADGLRYYRRPERAGGLIEQIGRTIRELIEEGIDPDELRGASVDPEADPVTEAKLHDIALIHAAYLRYLGSERLDPSQYLAAALPRMKHCQWLINADVFVDGFASFARQELFALIALSRLCARVEITMLCDPGLLAPGPPIGGAAPGELFAKTIRTHARIAAEFERAGVAVEPPLLLRTIRTPRFSASAALGELEQNLFDPDAAGVEHAAAPVGVRLLELPSRRVEVEYAVSEVVRLVRDAKLRCRYGDIAIIARDLGPYHDLLSAALGARGVPHFVDRRRSTAHHPLVELLRAAVGMGASDMSPDSVRLALKTGLSPLNDSAADALENAIVASGVCGRARWADDARPLVSPVALRDAKRPPSRHELNRIERVEAARRAFLEGFGDWFRFLGDPLSTGARPVPGGDQTSAEPDTTPRRGRDWAAAMFALLESLGVGGKLADWSHRAEQHGDLDEAEEHRQVWRDVCSFIDDLGFALADEVLSIDELAEVLEAGLAQLSLGLAPPMLDQVLVGSIDRSRHPELRAVILIGFNDGLFPQPAAEDAILSDDDRATLIDAGVPVLAPAKTRSLEENLLTYIGVTRASERLTVTYATTDDEGKALRPSPYVAALMRACPGLTVERVSDPAASREDWDILSPADLPRRIAMELRARPTLGEDECDRRSVFNELYERVRGGADAASLGRATRAFCDPGAIRLSEALLGRVHAAPLETSISRLETFASCPFKYFAESTLGLKPRSEAALEAADVGTVHHAILEDFVRTLSGRDIGFGELDEAELAASLEASCGRVGAKQAGGGLVSLARDAYVLSRTRESLRRVLSAQRTLGRSGRVRPRGVEVPFGMDEPDGLSALEIRSPKGRRILLRGYIDRVDVAELADELLGVVVDYKTTRDKRLDLSGAYHGISLQLIGYLLALSEHGESLTGRPIRPIGAFYVSLSPKYESVKHPDDASEKNPTESPYGPRGLLRVDDFKVLDADYEDAGRSDRYKVFLKKDGTPGHVDSTDTATGEQFQHIMEHTRRRIGELADDILDGEATVRPIRHGTHSPCTWCQMRSVCRFEIGLNEVRYFDRMNRSSVFETIMPE